MTEAEDRALQQIAKQTDAKRLRQQAENARGKSELVERAALRRLVEIASTHKAGTVEYECWAMINTIEELRRAAGRKASRMNRMRPKISKDGEIAALEYCALTETEGFAEIIDYRMPELTAEAIVLRFPQHFTIQAQSASRKRLHEAGFEVSADGNVSAIDR
jgi:hypothetical protein